jgi:putative hydrolase of the HAD superfamily
MSPGYRAVFFDAGLTLIEAAASSEEVCTLVCARHGYEVSEEAVRRALPAARAYLLGQFGNEEHWVSEEGVRDLFVQFYTIVFRQIDGLSHPRALAEEVYDEYQNPACWRPYPDVIPVLEELQRRGLILGVISDWGTGLQPMFLELGLARYFDVMVVSAAVGVSKPNPHVFQLALARAGVEAREAIHVGDRYDTDVLGARAVGLTPVLLDRSGSLEGADCVVIRSLEEVLALL